MPAQFREPRAGSPSAYPGLIENGPSSLILHPSSFALREPPVSPLLPPDRSVSSIRDVATHRPVAGGSPPPLHLPQDRASRGEIRPSGRATGRPAGSGQIAG